MNVGAANLGWATGPDAGSSPGRELDLGRYLRRIGYAGDLSPGPALLGALAAHHTAAIPFENLDPLLRVPVRLDLAWLQAKMIDAGRGGYCFEHNLLLAHVLAALGFRVRGLAARVLWEAPETSRPPRSHMLLLVDLGDRYVVDVGFGGLTLTGALRLEPDVEQATPHEPFRLLRVEDDFVMQAKVAGSWRPLYRFDLQPQILADYEVTNWYLSNHPASRFLDGLIAARAAPGVRYALWNATLAIHSTDGATERRSLPSVAALREVLGRELRIALPAVRELDPLLERLMHQAPVSRA